MNLIYRQRFERAVQALCQNEIDAWVILGRETHLLGEPALMFMVPFDLLNRTALVVTARNDRICLISAIEAEEAADTDLFSEIEIYPKAAEFESELTRVLAELMPAEKIAIDSSFADPSSDGLSSSDFLLLQRCLESAGFTGELVTAAPVMKQVRGRKSDEEVAKILATVTEAMQVFEEARPLMRLGLSGLDVQRLFQDIIDRNGLGYSWEKAGNPFVSIGVRSSYNCRKPPADVYIQPGDLVNVDLGVRLDGFASDNQRSFYALRPGETCPPYEVQHAFETIQMMNKAVCEAMKTGTSSDDLTAIGNEVMLAQHYEQGWHSHYGHEIGIYAHQGGIAAGRHAFRPDLDTTLEENMTFTLEPAILTSSGRLCQEEVVRVTVNGGEMLSTPQSRIWLIQA